jgi:hypothetical protein
VAAAEIHQQVLSHVAKPSRCKVGSGVVRRVETFKRMFIFYRASDTSPVQHPLHDKLDSVMSSHGASSGLADDGVVTKSVNTVFGLEVATTWEKDPLTGVK